MNRGDLLAKLTDAVVEGTLADTSLRNLAAAAGTSARMLIYHFESREALVRALASEITERWRLTVTETSSESDGLEPAVELSRLWHSISARRNERLIRALMQIQGRAISGSDGLDDSAATAIPVLRAAIEPVVGRTRMDPRTRRAATNLTALSMWGALEQIIITRDRVAPNEAVLGLIERFGIGSD